MKKLLLTAVVLLSTVLSLTNYSFAEDLNAIFKKVNDLVAAKNYSKAIEELAWANKEIEKLNSQHIISFFPDTLLGYTGKKAETNSALGITNIERTYSKDGAGTTVKVALTGSGGGAGAGAGLGGLAAFGRMAAMMGGQSPGNDTFRIAGRTATLEKEDRSAQLTVFLDSGSMLTLEMNNGNDADALKAMAEALDLNKLDNYLRGQG